VTVLGLGIAARRAFEKGIGQIVQGDGLGQREQVALLLVEKALQRGAVRQQPVAHPIQAHHI